MPQPIETVTMENYTMGILLLPQGSRSVNTRTLTLTAQVSSCDESIFVTSSAANTVLKGGNSLSFGVGNNPQFRYHVLINDDVIIDSVTPTEVSISPCKFVIPNGAEARLIDGLIPLYGIQDFPFQSNTTSVDVTNTRSGTGTEMKPVRNARTYQVSGKEVRSNISGDPALDLIKRVDRRTCEFARELYVVATYPDGEIVEGASVIENFNQAGNYNGVKEYSFTLTVQGNSMKWTQPYASQA